MNEHPLYTQVSSSGFMLSRFQRVVQLADQLRSAPVEIPPGAPIVLEDQGSLHRLKYQLQVYGLQSGMVLFLQVNEVKRSLLLKDTISVPLRIPSPLGWLGVNVAVERAPVEAPQVRFQLKVALRLGLLGSYTLVDRSLQYSSSAEWPSELPAVTDASIRVLVGLLRCSPSGSSSAEVLAEFMISLGLSAEQQALYWGLLDSQVPLDIPYEVLRNNPLSQELVPTLLELLPEQAALAAPVLQYLQHTCEQLGLDPKEVLASLPPVPQAASHPLSN